MRGRKPLPTHLKLVRGTSRSRRAKPVEVGPDRAPPEAPPQLSVEARAEWDRVVGELFELGIVTKLDRTILAGYCAAYALWADAERALTAVSKSSKGEVAGYLIRTPSGALRPHPLVAIASNAMRGASRLAAELGLTPTGRPRIRATPPSVRDPGPAGKYLD